MAGDERLLKRTMLEDHVKKICIKGKNPHFTFSAPCHWILRFVMFVRWKDLTDLTPIATVDGNYATRSHCHLKTGTE